MTEQEQRVEIALRTLAIPHEGNPHVNREVIAAANAVLLDALGGAPKPAVEPEPPLAGAEGTRDDLLSMLEPGEKLTMFYDLSGSFKGEP